MRDPAGQGGQLFSSTMQRMAPEVRQTPTWTCGVLDNGAVRNDAMVQLVTQIYVIGRSVGLVHRLPCDTPSARCRVYRTSNGRLARSGRARRQNSITSKPTRIAGDDIIIEFLAILHSLMTGDARVGRVATIAIAWSAKCGDRCVTSACQIMVSWSLYVERQGLPRAP